MDDRLDPLRKSVSFDDFFLCQPSGILFTRIHNNAKVLMPWIWDRLPVFWALAQKFSQFNITYYIEITCHYMATWSRQKLWIRVVARWGILGKTLKVELLQTCFVIKDFGSKKKNGYSFKKCMATPCIESTEGSYFGRTSDSKWWKSFLCVCID